MLLPIKPICPVAKMRQNGTSIIFLQYCQSPERKTLLNTEIAIPPKFWNRKLNRVTDDLPIEYGTAKSVNLEIHRLFRMAEDIITFAIRLGNLDPVNFVRQTFSPDFDINLLGIGKNKVLSVAISIAPTAVNHNVRHIRSVHHIGERID